MPKGGNKNDAMREAVKALSAAAKSLAQAADALSSLYEVEDTEDNTFLRGGTFASAPKVASLNYESEDDEDDYMDLAREAIGLSTKAVSAKDIGSPEYTPESTNMLNNAYGSIDLDEIQAFLPGGSGKSENTGIPQSQSGYSQPPSSPDQSIPSAPAKGPIYFGSLGIGGFARRPSSVGAREPFKNLINRWTAPTELQWQIIRHLNTEEDMLIIYGRLKSQTHAVLVHFLKKFQKQLPKLPTNPVGLISALIIVPQQSVGRMFLNYANELFKDFGLTCSALLLPGGGNDVNSEAQRMNTERIDILISLPRALVNHVNTNPNITRHLSRLCLVAYIDAQDLTKDEAFLKHQFNAIKKRMATRAKCPRQIVITASSMTEQVDIFATRALKPGFTTITSSDSGDQMQSIDWTDLLGYPK